MTIVVFVLIPLLFIAIGALLGLMIPMPQWAHERLFRPATRRVQRTPAITVRVPRQRRRARGRHSADSTD